MNNRDLLKAIREADKATVEAIMEALTHNKHAYASTLIAFEYRGYCQECEEDECEPCSLEEWIEAYLEPVRDQL